ncbi:probable disease resistance protein At1g58390 [Ziziphus jujuba]|uniref:Probable disease resistance protein At1g58390 n=1 Tax=Ziziphus jujuba TaxID=326968 RepID=A0ABM3I302_ZIZJJ|nr:probable disease resistance protein At1g58390 [Ziziphus jujuba]
MGGSQNVESMIYCVKSYFSNRKIKILCPSSVNKAALPEKVWRLSIHKPLENVGGGHDLHSLHSPFYFGAKDDSISNFSMSIFFNNGLRFLKVLDCREAPLNTFPKEILKLYNLRYLSLRDTNVSSIPKSIGKLQKLNTVDLRYINVTELPAEILQLKQLRQLLVYRYVHRFTTSLEVVGFKALRGLETLSSLQSLCFIEVNQGDSNLMKSLGGLTQLRRLCILKLKAEDGNYLCSSIEKLRFLLSLSLNSVSPDEVIDLQDMSSPPQCLQRLILTGKLCLKWSRLQVDPFECLQALPNLVHIELVEAYDGETLCFKADGFKMLKVLLLGKFDRLKRVTIERGTMSSLEKLMLRDCKLLDEVPTGIECLSNLKDLEFIDMSNEFLMKLNQRTDLLHISTIFVGYEADWGLDGYLI